MKKLTTLFTTALIGLSYNLFSQTGTTSYSENNDSRSGNYNVFFGTSSGFDNTGNFNTFSGHNSGRNNTTGTSNTFSGSSSGLSNTTGNSNAFLGYGSGRNNTTGNSNTFSGSYSGYNNETGDYNTFSGYNSGRSNIEGSYNIFSGYSSGHRNETGDFNVAIGYGAGFQNIAGSNNVFIGRTAGFNETSSNKLYIDNSSVATPLIYGDFATNKLTFNGKVSTGIGNTSFPTTVGGVNISDYTLFVAGGLLSEEVRIRTDWADYVFKDAYQLKSLNEVENFINTNGHLPNVPSATEVEASGIEMGEITKIQQEKIEELTLYLIDINKRLKLIEKENAQLKEELDTLSK